MKKIMWLYILIFILYASNSYSQNFGDEDKQYIISYLDSAGAELQALKQIRFYDIKEAIPVLESKFWDKGPIIREAYLYTLNILGSNNVSSIALALIDSAKGYIDTLHQTSSIMEANEFLIERDNLSQINYVFEWLNRYNNKPNSFYFGKSIIRVLPRLLDVPEYENQIKQQLYFIAQNEENSDYRISSTNALVKKYRQETIPFLLERINEDTTSYVRWNAFGNLNKLNYPEMKSVIKSYLTSESEFIYKIRLADTLLNKYGQPTEYAFLKNYAQNEEDPRAKEMISLYTQYVKPPKQPMSFRVLNRLDSLTSYTNQINNYSWLGDTTFVEQLNLKLTTAKTNLQAGDSLACRVQVKVFQDLVDNVYKDSLNTDPRFVTIEGWNLLYWNAQYILDRLPEPPANPNLVVSLKNSLGNQIPANNVMYYEGSWKDAVNNGDGTFTVITTKPTVSIRMFYEYANQTVHNVPAQNNTYTFTTVNAAVELRNSSGSLIDAGTVQYYAGAWRSLGTTVNGVAYKELLPINYSFRMIYEYVLLDKQQDISTNSTVTFSTVLCTVKVTKANGQPLPGANTKYYSGAWRDIGLTNANGEATKELLPKSLSFRATSGNVNKDKQQDIGVNNLVEIQLP